MTTLPPALRPWHRSLGELSLDLALALVPLFQRIDALLGPLPAPGGLTPGDWDGYDGLTRRGPLERLLLTEWALHDAVPEEFLRRAAQGEQLYLRPATRQRSEAARTIVLFDAGPDLAGGPRLTQLVAFLVLEERAHRLGRDFHWGVLQDESRAVQTRGGLDGTRILLGLTSGRGPHGADGEQWRLLADDAEILCVAAQEQGGPTLLLEDVLEPGPQRVRARLSTGSKTVELELPPLDVAVRLLRGDFGTVRPQPPRRPKPPLVPGRGPLRFSQDGQFVWGPLATGGVWCQTVPNSPRASHPLLSLADPPGGMILALGRRNQRPAAVEVTEQGALSLVEFGRKGGIANVTPLGLHPDWPGVAEFRGPPTRAPGQLQGQRRRGAVQRLWFHDGAGTLFLWDINGLSSTPAAEVCGGCESGDAPRSLLWISPDDPHTLHRRATDPEEPRWGEASVVQLPPTDEKVEGVLFGWMGGSIVQTTRTRFRILTSSGTDTFRESDSVLRMPHHKMAAWNGSSVHWRPGDRTVTRYHAGNTGAADRWQAPAQAGEAALAQVAADPGCRTFAALDLEGRLVLRASRFKEDLLVRTLGPMS
jgi:hypothetical protein